MPNCVVLGSKSDIANGLMELLGRDGWTIQGWARGRERKHGWSPWDLCICALGRVGPVGHWSTLPAFDYSEHIGGASDIQGLEGTFTSNLFLPLQLLRAIWPLHNPGASICFMAGSNPNMIMNGYLPYNISKMALLKAVEQMDHETPDAKFFALGPGIVNTKIHLPTLKAKWPNKKLEEALAEGRSTPIDRIYACLKWCIKQPKDVIGGRNLCVSDNWDQGWIERFLKTHPSMYKLRRQGI